MLSRPPPLAWESLPFLFRFTSLRQHARKEKPMAGRNSGARGFPSFVAVVAAAFGFLAGAALANGGGGDSAGIFQMTERRRGDAALPRNDWLLGTAVEAAFVSFARRYNKDYATREEYLYRLGVIARNAVRAAEHQAMDPTAVHGVAPFSDLTEEEFERQFTGLQGRGEVGGAGRRCGAEVGGEVHVAAPDLDVRNLPSNFDCREKGAVTEVKMQGVCGSCWAFSTTGAVEGANFLATGKLIGLSEQQPIDCDHMCHAVEKDACDNGCSGGLMTNAYEYLLEAGGLEEEKSYPYTAGRVGECKFEAEKVAVRVTNFTNVPLDENQVAAYLVRHGPLAVGLNAAFVCPGTVLPADLHQKVGEPWRVLLVGYGSGGFSILD